MQRLTLLSPSPLRLTPQIVIEALIAFAVFLVGVPLTSQPLMKISWESYMQSKSVFSPHFISLGDLVVGLTAVSPPRLAQNHRRG